jgi:hypothetical protein
MKEKKTELRHTFYRLSFIYFQGLCSMELHEREEQEKKDSQTLLIIVNDTHMRYRRFVFFMIQNE